MPDTTSARRGLDLQTLELPERGFPMSENAITAWFSARHSRAPTEVELGAIIGAMSERDAESPRSGPNPLPEGWTTGPSVPPATRR